MSNRICIEPTEFVNVRAGVKSYGVRVYDTYGCGYYNCWDSIPDGDIEVIRQTIEIDIDPIKDTMNWIAEQHCGVYVGDSFYEWEEIQHLFGD
jgi:hypothetical protein